MNMTVRQLSFHARRDFFFDAARAATGLVDVGADDFAEGFDLFLKCLDEEAILSPAGELATASFIEMFLVSRLYSEEGWKRRPEALARPIQAPVIITGIVRSGTTALHKLMSMDPQFQGIEHWLTRAPQPRPPHALWPENPNYREACRTLAGMIATSAELETDHMMAADEVEESLFLLTQSFKNNMLTSQWNIPTYEAWYLNQDETDSYQRFAKNLQLIGANEPEKRWLLKNPTDLLALDAVLNVFPDAMIIQTHRDPVQSIPSIANLIAAARRLFEGPDSSPHIVGRRECGFWALALQRATQARTRAKQPVFDLEFKDFVQDQLGAVKAIYAHFGLILTHDVEQAMQAWLAAHPRQSTGMQRFSPEDFSLSADELRRTYASYRAARGYE